MKRIRATFQPLFADQVLVHSAIRFTVASSLAMILSVALFGKAEVAFASYGACALAFFCDFDGTFRERLVANLVASTVGLGGVLLGALVAPSFWVTVVAMFFVSFCFAFARLFRGFISRSAVGVQLGFILSVIIQPKLSHLGPSVASWILGCGIATLTSLFLLPRHHADTVRHLLGDWCKKAATLTRALRVENGTAPAIRNLQHARDALVAHAAGTQEWPGSLFKRQRALNSLYLCAESGTGLIERFDRVPLSSDTHFGDIGEEAARAFDVAGDVIIRQPVDRSEWVEDIWDVMASDLQATKSWVTASIEEDTDRTLEEIEQHHSVRVMALLADVVERYSLIASGHNVEEPQFGPTQGITPGKLISDNLSFRSVWFRNALRVAVCMALSIGIQRHYDLSHGFWLVLTTLAIVNVSYTRHDAGKASYEATIGTLIGGVIGGILIVMSPPIAVFIVLVPFIAFTAKLTTAAGAFLGQISFSLYSVVMFTLIGWPPAISVVVYRIEWVSLAVVIAMTLTFIAFPRGHTRIIKDQRSTAFDAADVLLSDASELLIANPPRSDNFLGDLDRLGVEVGRYSDILGSVYHASHAITPELEGHLTEESWLLQTLATCDAIHGYLEHGFSGITQPALIDAFRATPTHRLEAIRKLALSDPALVASQPRALISAVWSAQWLHDLARTRPKFGDRLSADASI